MASKYHVLHLPRKNSRTFKTLASYDTVEDLLQMVRYNRFTNFEKPYIFSSIHCESPNGTPFRITQTETVGLAEILVSPTKLFDRLVQG